MRKVVDLVIAEFGVSPTARDIQSYVKDVIMVQSPLKIGRAGDFYLFVFNTLCIDFEIFIKSIKSTVEMGRILIQSWQRWLMQ